MTRTSFRSTTRRDFLKTTGGAVALGTLALSRAVHAAGDDLIRVGMIGAGGRFLGGAAQAMNADPGVRITAVADIFQDRVDRAVEALRGAGGEQVVVDADHCFVGFDAGQKVIQSDVDVVLIACASRFHAPYMKMAVEAGKHVFVEKPAAIDPAGYQTLLEATQLAEEKKLNVVSGLHLRYDPAVKEAMQRIHDGAIGEVVALEANFMRNPYAVIGRNPAWSEIEFQYRTWYHFNWLSGDDVVQSIVHPLDVAAWAMHDQPPVWAHGLGGRSSLSGPEYGNCFDHAAVVWEYPNGVRMYGLNRTQNGCYGDFSTGVFGSKGSARLQTNQSRIVGENPWEKQSRIDGHQIEQNQLFAAIRTGQTVNNGVYMARSAMASILGQFAAYTGVQKTWEELTAGRFAYGPERVDFDTEPPVLPGPDGNYPVAVPGLTKMG